MAEKCIQELAQALSKIDIQLDKLQRGKVNQEYLDWVQQLQKAGRRPNDLAPVDPKYPNIQETFMDKWIKSQVTKFIDAATDRENAAIMTTMRVNQLKRDMIINMNNLAERFPDKRDQAIKAYNSLIFNTNETYGHQTLQGTLDAEEKAMLGNLIKKLSELMPEQEDVVGLFTRDALTSADGKTQTAADRFFIELFHLREDFQKNKNTSLTKDPIAFNMAKSVIEHVIAGPSKAAALAGRLTEPFDLFPQVIFKAFKMRNEFKDADAFADFFHVHLNDSHGGVLQRKALSIKIYNEYMRTLDYRIVNQIAFQEKKIIADGLKSGLLGQESAIDIERQISQIPNTLQYRNGESFLAVNKKLGDVVGLGEILERAIKENSRLVGLVRFAGPNFEEGLARLRREVMEDFQSPVYADIRNIRGEGDKIVEKATQNYISGLIDPAVAESGYVGAMHTTMTAARNIATTKLGGAVISNVGDVGTFGYVGWSKIYDRELSGIPKLIKAITGYDFTGSTNERAAANAMIVDFAEVVLGSMTDRFRMLDVQSGSRGTWMQDKIVKGSAAMAHFVLRMTGFNALNRHFAKGAASALYRAVGDMIGGGKQGATQWDNLKPMQRQMFEKFGIFKIDYDTLLEKKPLDASGKLDLFKLKEESLATSAPLQRRLMTMMNEMTETMVLKPGALDRQLVGFLGKPGSTSQQFFKAITQFQTYMITFSRKILMNDVYKPGMDHVQRAKNLALIFAFMYPLAFLTQAAKNAVAGKEQKNFDDAALDAFFYTNFLPFVGDLYWSAGGQQIWDALLSDGESRTPTLGQFLEKIAGPVLTDFSSIAVNGAKLATEGIKFATDKESDIAALRSAAGRIVDTLNDNFFLNNMWMTRAVWRHTVFDAWLEWLDPQGYKKMQRRLRKQAREERQDGNLYNFYGRALTGE